MWWRFRKHHLAMAAGLIVLCFYLVAIFADVLATTDPELSDAKRSLMPPQRIHWFDGWSLQPHVYAVKRARDPKTFKRVYQVDPTQNIPVYVWAHGFRCKLFGLMPMNHHLLGVGAGYEADQTLFILGTDVQGRDLWSRLLYAPRISVSIGLVGVALSLFLGVLLGGLSGFYSGWVGTILPRPLQIFRSIPPIPPWMRLCVALPRSML